LAATAAAQAGAHVDHAHFTFRNAPHRGAVRRAQDGMAEQVEAHADVADAGGCGRGGAGRHGRSSGKARIIGPAGRAVVEYAPKRGYRATG